MVDYVKFCDPSCIGFEVPCGKTDKQTYKTTNKRHCRPTHVTAFGVSNNYHFIIYPYNNVTFSPTKSSTYDLVVILLGICSWHMPKETKPTPSNEKRNWMASSGLLTLGLATCLLNGRILPSDDAHGHVFLLYVIYIYIYIYIYYKNKNWLQFLFIVKAAVLKQQISKFYPQIPSTEDSFYIYERPLTEINVIASFCALNMRIKF